MRERDDWQLDEWRELQETIARQSEISELLREREDKREERRRLRELRRRNFRKGARR